MFLVEPTDEHLHNRRMGVLVLLLVVGGGGVRGGGRCRVGTSRIEGRIR